MPTREMLVRRYRVGIDVTKYTRNFILGCVTSAVVTLVILTAVFISLHNRQMMYMRDRYETRILDLENEMCSMEAKYLEEISDLKIEYQEQIDELIAEIEQLQELNSEAYSTQIADFEFYKDYWYVFRDAPANSGITLELIKYVDAQCQIWDVNPQVMWCIYDLETGMNPNLDNTAGSGARGLGQVMPGTGKYMWETILGHGSGSYTHTMAYDPFVNAEISVAHIGRDLRTKSLYDTINAYSGGGGDAYYGIILSNASDHGVSLDRVHYPYKDK